MSDRTADPRTGTWTALASLPAAVAVLVAAVMGRGLWFFSDDWNMFGEYHSGNLLEPFNGHLSLVPAGLYQLLFHTRGVGSYTPYRVLGLVALAVLGFQVARLAVVRVDGAVWRRVPLAPVVGALAAAAVLWASTGQMNLLFPFLLNFTIPIAALPAIWWHLDRAERGAGVAGDAAASVWLAVALATSGLGVMTALAVGVELVLRRAPWRRWLVLAPGPILWAVWFLTHRDSNELSTDPGEVLSYAGRMLLAGLTSLGAGWAPAGIFVGLALVGLVVLAATRWRSLDGRAVGALAAPVAFALFTAVTRIGVEPRIEPDELRYSWAVAAYLVLAALVLVRPAPVVRLPEWAGVALLGVGTALVVAGAGQLLGDMDRWVDQVAAGERRVQVILAAAEAVGPDRIDPDLVLPINFVPVTAGEYFSGVAAVGSPLAGPPPDDLGADAASNRDADELVVDQMPIEVRPEAAVAECRPMGHTSAGIVARAPGLRVRIDRSAVQGPASLGVSRFSEAGAGPELPLPDAPVAVVELPRDADGADAAIGRFYELSLPDGVLADDCE